MVNIEDKLLKMGKMSLINWNLLLPVLINVSTIIIIDNKLINCLSANNTVNTTQNPSSSSSMMMMTTIKTIQCRAKMSPKQLQQPFDQWSIYGSEISDDMIIKIVCLANLYEHNTDKDYFMHPVFDLSFGDTTNTGLYIVRGKSVCENNHSNCKSEFNIPRYALFKLLLPSSSASAASNTIKVTCDIADTSSESRMPIRCSDSTIYRLPKVLNYGDQCSSTDQCKTNMECSSITNDHINLNKKTCSCKHGYANITKWFNELNKMKTICVPRINPTNIEQTKCFFDEQCQSIDSKLICTFNKLFGHPTCQCLREYRLKIDSQKAICQSINDDNDSNDNTPKEKNITKQQYHRPLQASYLSNESAQNRTSIDNDKVSDNDSSSNHFSDLSLVIFLIILLWIIVIGALVFRYVKQKRQLNINDGKQRPPPSLAINDNQIGKKTNTDQNDKIIRLNSNNDNDNIDEMHFGDCIDDDLTRKHSKVVHNSSNKDNSLNKSTNFDIFAKQSIV